MKTEAPLAGENQPHREPPGMMSATVTFVWIYLAFAGVLGVIYGIATLRNRDYFRDGNLLWSNLTAWGWLAIALGALAILLSVKLYQRRMSGVIGGMAVAIMSFIANFLSIGAYPAWSIIAMVVNGYVIWALPRAVYGMS